MAPGSPALVLTPTWRKERLLLVQANVAVRLCREGGYEALPRRQAEVLVREAVRRDHVRVRDFVGRAYPTALSLPTIDELLLVELLRKMVRERELVVLREGEGGSASETSSLVRQRHLVRAIDTKMRAALNYQGRKYKLVADADLNRISGRDDTKSWTRRRPSGCLTP